MLDKAIFPDEVYENFGLLSIITALHLQLYIFTATSLANSIRYQQTIWDCEKYLRTELDADTVHQISRLKYDEHDELHSILTSKGIEATLLFSDPYKPVKKSIDISHEGVSKKKTRHVMAF